MVFGVLSLELPSPLALLFRAANVFRVMWSDPQIRHPKGIDRGGLGNVVQGLGKV